MIIDILFILIFVIFLCGVMPFIAVIEYILNSVWIGILIVIFWIITKVEERRGKK